jgi:hypothetical protein
MDIFDDLVGAGADEGPLSSATSTAAVSAGVLVVGEVAPTGQSLHAEEQVYLRTAGIPQIIFEALDPDTGEIAFQNAEEYRQAMGSLVPVSIDAALAWCGVRVGAVFEAHRAELEEAYLTAVEAAGPRRQPPGPDAVQLRARMPNTTGRDRGQSR